VSYLANYTTRRLAEFEALSNGVRLNLRRMLNLAGHHG